MKKTIILILLVAAAISSHAATITVTGIGDTIAVDGAVTLREAITSANNNLNVNADVVAAGTYGDDTIIFNLPGAGPHIINLSGALPDLSSNISIDNDDPGAEGVAVRRDTGGDYRIFLVASNQTVSIAGLTITNGRVVGANGDQGENVTGGGIFNLGTLNLTNCIVSNNSLRGGDSITAVFGGRASGGAIYNQGMLNLMSTTLVGNNATGGNNIRQYGAGGIAFGGGIFNQGTHTLTNTTLTDNQALGGNSTGGDSGGGSGNGGAIYNNGPQTLINCTLSGNAADGGNGAQYRGDGYGGGVYVQQGFSALENCTVTGNSALRGGGPNGGFTRGGGLRAGGYLNNTIVAGNIVGAEFSTGPDVHGSFEPEPASAFNIIGNGSDMGGLTHGNSGNQVGVNPLLGTLQDNGGPTDTHALLDGSPAIDKGKSFNTTTDQRGFLRPEDLPGIENASGGDGSDIGAFESGASPPPVELVTVVSRKVHGGQPFNINLPLTGDLGIECRTGGTYRLIFTFANPLTSVDGASVTSGIGSVPGNQGTIGANAHQYIVNLTGVTNDQVITVTLTNVNDSVGNSSSAVPISMGVLIGDTTGNGSVNSSDIGQTKSRSGQTAGQSNFRSDVNFTGAINSSDIGLVKSKSGTDLP